MENSNTQNSQTLQPSINEPAQSLEVHYKRAIDMKLRGFRYEMIASALTKAGSNVVEGTVRSWFVVGGKCYDEFQRLKEIRMTELQNDINLIDNQLKEAAVDAVAVIRNKIASGDLRAAMDALDRAGYIKKQGLEIGVSQELTEAVDLLQGLLNKKKNEQPA